MTGVACGTVLKKMMFGTEISRLDAKPFNIFTCVLSFFSQPAMAPTPVQSSPWGPRYFAARSVGYKKGFGTKVRAVIKEAQPQYADGPKLFNNRARKNKLLVAKKHPSQHTIEATGLLSSFASANAVTDNLERLSAYCGYSLRPIRNAIGQQRGKQRSSAD
jgi:hypothetical protein